MVAAVDVYYNEEDDEVEEMLWCTCSHEKFIPIGKWSVNVVNPVKNLKSCTV